MCIFCFLLVSTITNVADGNDDDDDDDKDSDDDAWDVVGSWQARTMDSQRG